jgi:hypothetical protein
MRSHTSTVVLPGSSAGLMSETFAGTGSSKPGTTMVADAPFESCWAWVCARWSLANSAEVSMTVITGVPAAAVSPAKSGRSVTTPGDGTANLGVAQLGFGAQVLALGGGELALRAFQGRLPADLLHRFEMLLGYFVGGLGLNQAGFGGIQIAAGNRSLGEELGAAVHNALRQVQVGAPGPGQARPSPRLQEPWPRWRCRMSLGLRCTRPCCRARQPQGRCSRASPSSWPALT